MTTATAPVTDAQIDAAILAALEPTGGELVPWRSIRDQIPGNWDRKSQALVRLFERHAIYMVKLGGLNYLRLADNLDHLAAAAERDRQSQRHRLPVSRCRSHVAV